VFERFACAISHVAGKPWATLAAFLAILAWGSVGPLFGFSEGWQLLVNTGTTIITFLMTFIIQASQNRDGAAIQAKLDELIRASREARDAFIGLDHKPIHEIETARGENDDG
jgi:low affinity Fe/Cu permease